MPDPVKLAFSLWHGLNKQCGTAAWDYQDCSRRRSELGEEESRQTLMLRQGICYEHRQRAEYHRGNAIQSSSGRAGGPEAYYASEEGIKQRSERTVPSGSRGEYIYINSLLCNHDKQNKKTIHTKI